MRCLNYLAIGLVIFCGCAGTYEKITPEQARFEKIYQTNIPKDKIYEKCLQWIAQYFKSAKAVLEYQDKEAGKIIGNGTTNILNVMVEIPVTFTMEITIKEGKFRIVFDNLIALWGEYHNQPQPIQGTKNVEDIHAKFADMCERLNDFINKNDDF